MGVRRYHLRRCLVSRQTANNILAKYFVKGSLILYFYFNTPKRICFANAFGWLSVILSPQAKATRTAPAVPKSVSEFYGTYEGLKTRLDDYGTGVKRGFNKWGDFGYWKRERREYSGEESEANGNTLGGATVVNDRKVWVSLSGNGQRLGGTRLMQTGGGNRNNGSLFYEGEGWGIRTPQFTARIGVGAGAGFLNPAGSLQYFYRHVSFLGLKNNNFEIGNKMYSLTGNYIGKYERKIWEAGFILHSSHENEKFTDSDGYVTETDTRTTSLGIFEAQITTDLTSPFKTTTTTFSINFSYLMGAGLFAEFGAKLPVYQKTNW